MPADAHGTIEEKRDTTMRSRRLWIGSRHRVTGHTRTPWTDDSGRQRLTESVATPDIASVDTRGQPTVYDVVITVGE